MHLCRGRTLKGNCFCYPPPEFRREHPGIVWRVIKRVYGLRDAPRGWWLECDTTLKELGCVRIQLDHAFYIYSHRKTGDILGFVLCHVDDFIYGGVRLFHKKVIEPIKKKYVIGACEDSLFTFTGWNLEQSEEGIKVTQRDYLNDLNLDQFDTLVNATGNNDDKLNQEQITLLMKANGILGWLAQVSKPELSYQYVYYSSIIQKATLGDAKKLVRLLKKAKTELDEIMYSNLGDVKNWRIKIYCDASFAKLNSTDTVIGDLVTLEGENGAIAILEWSANKLKVPANSPLNGESEAAVLAQGKICHYRHILNQIFGVNLPGEIITDSKSLKESVNSNNSVKDKRTSVNVSILRSVVEEDNMTISWISGAVQPADVFTKPSVDSKIVKTLMRTGNSNCLELFRKQAEAKKTNNAKS